MKVEIPIERQKAAQAAGNFALEDLPGPLATPAAAVRLGRTAAQDTPLVGVRSTKTLLRLGAGQLLANYGRSEAGWAAQYHRRRAGRADFPELLSYARQLIGVHDDGTIRICLMGHAGQGPSVPLWVPRDEVTLTTQPNDIVLRFDGVSVDP